MIVVPSGLHPWYIVVVLAHGSIIETNQQVGKFRGFYCLLRLKAFASLARAVIRVAGSGSLDSGSSRALHRYIDSSV